MKKFGNLQDYIILPYNSPLYPHIESNVKILEYDNFLKRKNLNETESSISSFFTIFTPILETDFRMYAPLIKLVEKMETILEKLLNNEELDKYELVFCEAITNYYCFSVTYYNRIVKNVMFCLRDRILIDPPLLNANTTFHEEVVTIIPLDNDNELKNVFHDVFKRISDQETYLKFIRIYEQFLVLAEKYLVSIHFDKIQDSKYEENSCDLIYLNKKNYIETKGYGIYDKDYNKILLKE